MIKVFTEPNYSIQNEVNNWLEENENTGKVEVKEITQSSCFFENKLYVINCLFEV